MIEQHGVAAHNVAAIMVPIAAVAVVGASAVIAEGVSAEVVVVVFEEVVAGANGTVGRFRSEGDFPDGAGRGLDMGRFQARACDSEAAARASD